MCELDRSIAVLEFWPMRTMIAKWRATGSGKSACQGWMCSGCNWSLDMLAVYSPGRLAAWERKAGKKFEAHNCAEFSAAAAVPKQAMINSGFFNQFIFAARLWISLRSACPPRQYPGTNSLSSLTRSSVSRERHSDVVFGAH